MLLWGLIILVSSSLNWLELIKDQLSLWYSTLYFQFTILCNDWDGSSFNNFDALIQVYIVLSFFFTIFKFDFSFQWFVFSSLWVQGFLLFRFISWRLVIGDEGRLSIENRYSLMICFFRYSYMDIVDIKSIIMTNL